MLFATTGLAAQIERAECGMLKESVKAVRERHPERDVMSVPLAGGVAAYSGPGSPLNKVSGLGFDGPVSEAELAEVERLYAERGCPVQIELSTLADPALGSLLTTRGYRLVGFENVLGTSPSEAAAAVSHSAASDIDIEVCDEEGFEAWLGTVVTAFLNPDSDGIPSHEVFTREVLEEVLRDMSGASSFVRYLARRGGEPAGGASMRTRENVALLTGAATLPAHRRKGVQGTLLARRLGDASRAGCDVVVVTTQPGSLSQRNVQRKNFDLLYARAVFVLDDGRSSRPG